MACQQAYSPSSNIAVDEAMVASKGYSKSTINIKATSYGVLVTMVIFGAGSFILEYRASNRSQKANKQAGFKKALTKRVK